MMYDIDFTTDAREGLARLGHPEPLKGQPEGRWSREITKKHRLVYRIFETEVLVLVLRSYGHYDDK